MQTWIHRGMVILVILKSLCVFFFCFWRVAISPVLYSVSFNRKAPLVIWSVCHGVFETLGVSGINDLAGYHAYPILRLLNERLRHDLHSVASLEAAIPLKLGPCPCPGSSKGNLKMDGFFQCILKTETDVLWLQVRSAQLRLLNLSFTGPTHKKTQHQLNDSMD